MNFDWSWCKCESTRINTVFHEKSPAQTERSFKYTVVKKNRRSSTHSQRPPNFDRDLWGPHIIFNSTFSFDRLFSPSWTLPFDARPATLDLIVSKMPYQIFCWRRKFRLETVNSKILQSQIFESFCILKSFRIVKPTTIQNTICYVPLREITWIKVQFKSRYTIWL